MQPTDPSQWRLAFAQQIAQKLAQYEGVRAIIVAGSVARGYADEYSDLEMPLFWEQLPTDEVRLAIAADLGADFLYPYSGPALEDNLLIHGFQVDLWHNTVQNEEQLFERVLRHCQMDSGESNFMDTIRFCVPLYGEDLIREWKEKAGQYPDELAVRQIQQAVGAMQATHLSVLAYRDNPTLLYGQISELQKQVFLVLLTLNRRYFPTYKWIYPTLGELTIKPAEVEVRFRAAYTSAPAEAAQDTARLVEETLRLVQAQFPELDTTPVRHQLRLTRTAHKQPVRLDDHA